MTRLADASADSGGAAPMSFRASGNAITPAVSFFPRTPAMNPVRSNSDQFVCVSKRDYLWHVAHTPRGRPRRPEATAVAALCLGLDDVASLSDDVPECAVAWAHGDRRGADIRSRHRAVLGHLGIPVAAPELYPALKHLERLLDRARRRALRGG